MDDFSSPPMDMPPPGGMPPMGPPMGPPPMGPPPYSNASTPSRSDASFDSSATQPSDVFWNTVQGLLRLRAQNLKREIDYMKLDMKEQTEKYQAGLKEASGSHYETMLVPAYLSPYTDYVVQHTDINSMTCTLADDGRTAITVNIEDLEKLKEMGQRIMTEARSINTDINVLKNLKSADDKICTIKSGILSDAQMLSLLPPLADSGIIFSINPKEETISFFEKDLKKIQRIIGEMSAELSSSESVYKQNISKISNKTISVVKEAINKGNIPVYLASADSTQSTRPHILKITDKGYSWVTPGKDSLTEIPFSDPAQFALALASVIKPVQLNEQEFRQYNCMQIAEEKALRNYGRYKPDIIDRKVTDALKRIASWNIRDGEQPIHLWNNVMEALEKSERQEDRDLHEALTDIDTENYLTNIRLFIANKQMFNNAFEIENTEPDINEPQNNNVR